MARLVIVVPLRLACLVLSPGLAKQHLVVDHAPHDGPADAEASLAREYQPSKVAREVVGRQEGGEGGEERQKGGGRPGWGGQAPLEFDELLLKLPQLPARLVRARGEGQRRRARSRRAGRAARRRLA